MGALRLRHCELLDAIGKMLMNDSTCLSTVRMKCIQSLIRTCAAVQYSPLTLPTLIEQHVQFDQWTFSREENQSIETKNRIDLVWALTILDQANADHLAHCSQSRNLSPHTKYDDRTRTRALPC